MSHGINLQENYSIGDDIIDIPAPTFEGFSFAPLDGNTFVKEKVDYVTEAKNGQGVLTELIDLIISCKFILKAKFLTNYEIK